MAAAGYSGTPLARKLGFKPGSCVLLRHAPAGHAEWIAPLPAGLNLAERVTSAVDIVHWFALRKELR